MLISVKEYNCSSQRRKENWKENCALYRTKLNALNA